MTYDVDRERAARQARESSVWYFRLDGVLFALPVEISRDRARALRKLDDSDVDGLLRLLLGDAQYEAFDGVEGVTMQDIAGILEAYGEATGLGLPQ